MRSLIRYGALLAALFPAAAFAQDGLGLDLSDETKEEKKEEVAPPAEVPSLPTPSAEPKKSEDRMTEAEIAAEDRVKSVQRKPFLKVNRFELTPMAFTSLNDAYYPKWGASARAAFYVKDSLGVAVRGNWYNAVSTDNVRLAKRELQSRLPKVYPNYSLSADLLWSPVYGKVSLFNAIHHFELYVVGGIDAIDSQTSYKDGFHLGTHLGLGQRFSLADWFTVDLGLLETLYSDRPDDGPKSILQHMLTVYGGVSVFLPMSFDYREN